MNRLLAFDAPAQGADETPLRLLYIADSRSIHTARWIRFFAQRGHKVALASQLEPQHGLEVEAFFPLSTKAALPGARLFRNVREVKSAIKKFCPDVLHAHYINENGWLGALSGFHPFALTAWGSDVYLAPTQSKLAAFLSPLSVKRADYVSADSFDQIERLKQMGAKENAAHMIAWGVDLDTYPVEAGQQWRAKHGIEPNALVVLSPRQWIANSNIDTIIEAWTGVAAQCPGAKLVLKRMKGTEEFNAQLESLIQKAGLNGSVVVVGEMPEADLPAMYAASDVAVSICSSDGTPVSVLEAMAARTPVVAGDLPSLRQWIDEDKSGFLVAPRDAKQLASRLSQILENAALRQGLGEGARRTAEERAGRDANLQKVEAALYELRARRKNT